MYADVVVDLQYGDCGKGKVAHHLCRTGDYTHVIRYNGGCNAGHTIYHEGKKFVTHHIPCGVFFGIRSIIGPGCVINTDKFLEEIDQLDHAGIDTTGLIKVAHNAHVITDFHLAEDSRDVEIGTTKRGNGPAYRDKYARKGVRAVDDPRLSEYIVEIYDELYDNKDFAEVKILFEGAQGFGLDIDWGDYPYVTSSHCTIGGAILNGVSHRNIRDVWGVAKVYETYVGAKDFQGEDPDFDIIRELGDEYGATTGRPRQVNWFDMDRVNTAININGVNKLVINKVDILRDLGRWSMYHGVDQLEFESAEDMNQYLSDNIESQYEVDIYFSEDKHKI
jgi:adenylosuccinate synthase